MNIANDSAHNLGQHRQEIQHPFSKKYAPDPIPPEFRLEMTVMYLHSFLCFGSDLCHWTTLQLTLLIAGPPSLASHFELL